MVSLDPEFLRRSNRMRVLDALRLGGRMARVELAEATELSPATVSAVTAELIAEGLVEEPAEQEAAEQAARRGRPRVLLQLRPEAAYVAGVKISMHQISVSITNFVGEMLGAETVSAPASRQQPEVIADLVEAALRQTLEHLGLPLAAIAGVGVGLPGFIDCDAGVSHWSPVFGDETVPFGALMSGRLGRPVFVDNDANLVTLAEQWFGDGKGLSNFLVVTIEHGVGMGAVIGGQLYRGARGFGAEFGHMKIQRDGALCRCGQRGCIEAYLADYALLREASTFAPAPDPSDPIQRNAALHGFIRQALEGDARLCAIFERAGGILGVGVANLINVLGPELVIVSGEGAKAAALFEPAMRRAIQQNALSVSVEATPVIVKQTTDVVWARGAAALVLTRQLGPAAAASAVAES